MIHKNKKRIFVNDNLNFSCSSSTAQTSTISGKESIFRKK